MGSFLRTWVSTHEQLWFGDFSLAWGNCCLKPYLSNLSFSTAFRDVRPALWSEDSTSPLSIPAVFSLPLYFPGIFPNKTHTSNTILGSASKTTHLQLLHFHNNFTQGPKEVTLKSSSSYSSITINTESMPLKTMTF